jgi:hypothetical protein
LTDILSRHTELGNRIVEEQDSGAGARPGRRKHKEAIGDVVDVSHDWNAMNEFTHVAGFSRNYGDRIVVRLILRHSAAQIGFSLPNVSDQSQGHAATVPTVEQIRKDRPSVSQPPQDADSH